MESQENIYRKTLKEQEKGHDEAEKLFQHAIKNKKPLFDDSNVTFGVDKVKQKENFNKQVLSELEGGSTLEEKQLEAILVTQEALRRAYRKLAAAMEADPRYVGYQHQLNEIINQAIPLETKKNELEALKFLEKSGILKGYSKNLKNVLEEIETLNEECRKKDSDLEKLSQRFTDIMASLKHLEELSGQQGWAGFLLKAEQDGGYMGRN